MRSDTLTESLNRNRLSQISWFIDIAAAYDADIVGQKLEWNAHQDGLDTFMAFGYLNDVFGEAGGKILSG